MKVAALFSALLNMDVSTGDAEDRSGTAGQLTFEAMQMSWSFSSWNNTASLSLLSGFHRSFHT